MDWIVAIIVWIVLGGFALLSLITVIGIVCAIILSSKVLQEEEKENVRKHIKK